MYRYVVFSICLSISSLCLADIYQWTGQHGNTAYGQQRPVDKSIPYNVISKEARPASETQSGSQLKSIQETADELEKANAVRQAKIDDAKLAEETKKQSQAKCESVKASLAALDFGGNRLYKDSDGNYSRLADDDKNRKRQEFNQFLDENCR